MTLPLKQVKTALSGSTPQFPHLPYYPYRGLEFTCNFKRHKQREAEELTAEKPSKLTPEDTSMRVAGCLQLLAGDLQI